MADSRRILLTGGAGFIGSQVACHLILKYPHYHVVVLDKLDICSSKENLAAVEDRPNFTFIKGDILSADLINYVLETERIDTILHFAASTHVDNSFGNSLNFTQNNVLGTHNLLEAARQHALTNPFKLFIHVSTDEVYGETPSKEAVEDLALLNPTNPYAATKAAAEFLVKAYHHSFNLPIIITRGNNVYGPHQYPEKVIPKFINRLNRDMSCTIHGDGSNKRYYVYITDVAEAFEIIMHKGEMGQIYNIGSDLEISNLDLASRIITKMEKNPKSSLVYVRDRKFNDCRYHIDYTKLRKLGWTPKVDFDQGLDLTIAWYTEIDIDKYWSSVAITTALSPQT